MPRTQSSDRLTDIAAAATRVFGRLGYRRTRTADVATQAGLSTGGLFTYVDSKEALFHLVFVAGFGDLDAARTSLPLSAPPFDDTIELIRKGLANAMAVPTLTAAARRDAPADGDDVRAELATIVAEQFANQTRAWPLIAVIERSAADLPPLEAIYFTRGRRGRIELVERYLARRATGGHVPGTLDTKVAARFLIETVTWFAWHRREDRDAELYDDDVVLATITTLVGNALVAES
jgi:AcrR family transcriptional regulator